MRMALVVLVVLTVGCGGSECSREGDHAFAAALQLSSDNPTCASDAVAFGVVLTFAGGAWTVTQDGTTHPADFAFARGCNVDLFWYDRTTTPATVHEYDTTASNPYADVSHLGVCTQRYSLTPR